ncbi:hypothetical protein DOU54_01610 [Agrobacterium sp. MS2]|nr:hypothetical protein DOU54_01610 [Agrobacterium sp. MS2]
MQAGENVSKLANEAGVSRQRLYEWRDHLRLYGDLSSRRRGRPPRVVSIVDGAAPLQTAMIAPSPQEQSLTKARRRVRELEQKIGQQQLDIDFFRESDGSRRCHKPCPQEASHRAAIRSATFPPPEKLSYAPSWLLVYGPESVSGPECHATNSLLYYLYENIRLFGSVTAMSSLINISG